MKPVESFSFNQLTKITNIMNSPGRVKEEDPVVDSVVLDGSLTNQDMEVIILPGKSLLKSNFDPAAAMERFNTEGIELHEQLPLVNGVVAKTDPEGIKKLEDQGFVVYDNSPRSLLPNIPRSTGITDDKSGKPWDMPVVKDLEWTGVSNLHKEGLTGKGKVVAVIDSGYNHPEKPLKGWVDVVDKYPNPVDPNGHGTHVAGDVNKVAPDVELVGVRVMNDKGQGRPSDIVKGIEWVIKNKDRFGIDIINMSLGAGPDGIPYYMDPINKAVEQAIKQGIDVYAAAGNSGPGPGTIGSPADDPFAVAVGAALNPTKVSDFSSRGMTEDKIEKPDIVAPGEFIVSWAAPNSQLDNIAKTLQAIRDMSPAQLTNLLQNKPELIQALGLPENVMTLSPSEREKVVKTGLPPMFKPSKDTVAGPGTSFASPEVAGMAALLKQAVPTSTPAERKEVFKKTADSMGSQYGIADQGSGFVDVDEAVEVLKKSKQ